MEIVKFFKKLFGLKVEKKVMLKKSNNETKKSNSKSKTKKRTSKKSTDLLAKSKGKLKKTKGKLKKTKDTPVKNSIMKKNKKVGLKK